MKYTFRSAQHSILALFVTLLFFAGFFITASDAFAQTPRFEQLVKNAVVETNELQQKLSCSDLSGSIASVTLSLEDRNADNVPYRAMFYKSTETPFRVEAIARTSEIATTGARLVQEDLTFDFTNPIDVDGDLCAGNPAFIFLYVFPDDTAPSFVGANFYGGTNNPYTNGDILNAPAQNDSYFIVNASTEDQEITEVLQASKDAYSTTFAPGQQRGDRDFLRIQDVNKQTHKYKHMHRGFVGFDLSSISATATVATATARAYVSEVSKAGLVDVQLVQESWGELSLTMNNVPDVDFSFVDTVTIETSDVGSYVEFDVTTEITNWVNGTVSNHGFMFSPRGTAVEFGSKEGGQPVELVVTYTAN